MNYKLGKKMVLTEFYEGLGKLDAHKTAFKKRVALDCGKSAASVERWVAGTVTPSKLEQEVIAKIVGEMSGEHVDRDELFPN